jgi:hypothetical protein
VFWPVNSRKHFTAATWTKLGDSPNRLTVAKLRGARERRRREAGKCEGRKSHAERNPGLVGLAKRLRRQNAR